MTDEKFLHFLDQPIEVNFDKPPVHEKTPHCPDGFVWEEKTYRVIEKLSEWSDFTRRGRVGAEHAARSCGSRIQPRLIECGTLLLPRARRHRTSL